MNNKVENFEYSSSDNTMNEHSMPTVIAQPQIAMVQPIATNGPFGPMPNTSICPSCQHSQTSTIKYENNMKTHIVAIILCVTTCCCCIPYLVNSCKSVNHYCSNCGAYLSTYNN